MKIVSRTPALDSLFDLMQNDVIRIGIHRFLFMPLCQEGVYWDDEGALQ